MIKQTITIDEVITLLNELIALDKSAVAALLANRVPCNKALADHPTVQVGLQNDVGMLGVINGLFGVDDDGLGAICYESQHGDLIKFKRTPV